MRDRQIGQIAKVVFAEPGSRERPSDRGKVLKSDSPVDIDVLSGAVIVIAADGVRGIGFDPFDARFRFAAVIDQIAQEKTEVAALAHGLQRGPIRVNVG